MFIVVYNTTNSNDLKISSKDTLGLSADCPFYAGQFSTLEAAAREATEWKNSEGCVAAKVFSWKFETSDLVFDAFR